MKRFVILLFCFETLASAAQDLNEKISKLKAPTSPASVIIGNQPATISKPKSWQALEAAIYSNYVNQSGGLTVPNDYAIELSPYWLTKKGNISLEEFMTPNFMQGVLQNLNLSISSTKNFLIKDSLKTDALGFGFRTLLLQGKKSEVEDLGKKLLSIREKEKISTWIAFFVLGLQENIKNRTKLSDDSATLLLMNNFVSLIKSRDSTVTGAKLLNQIKGVSTVQQKTDDSFVSGLVKYLNDKEDTLKKMAPLFFGANDFKKWVTAIGNGLKNRLPNKKGDYLDEVNAILDDLSKLKADAKTVENIIKDRAGFKLELAGALALNFPTNKTDFSLVPRYSIWATPSFTPKHNEHWEFLLVGKYTYLFDDFYKNYSLQKDYFNSNFDYGTRIVYKWDKFSVECELVGRSSRTILEKTRDTNGIITEKIKTDSDFQYLLNLNYRISDSIVLSYNFGSQFKPTANSINSLVSLATLNFGIGGPKLKELPVK